MTTVTTPHLPDTIEHLATDTLVPYARNSRTHSPEQITALTRSIAQFGFTNPVLIDGHNTIIAGHGRVMAAQALGLPRVPCIRLTHLSDAQRRAYVIADNKLAEQAGWDMATLAREMEDLSAAFFDLDLLGFDTQEIDQILNKAASPMTAAEIQQIETSTTHQTTPQTFDKEMADTSTRGKLEIVPHYAEHHEAFIILSDNQIDEAWLRQHLGLEQARQSYKDVKSMRANVLTVQQYRQRLHAASGAAA